MTDLLLPDIDDALRDGLRRRAERNGRSIKAEARDILREALPEDERGGLGTRIAARFADRGLEPGELPQRVRAPIKPVDFESTDFDP